MSLLLSTLIYIVITAAFGLIARYLIFYLIKLRSTPQSIKDLCSASGQPILWLIWIYGLSLIVEYLLYAIFNISFEEIGKARQIILAAFLTWIVYKWKVKYIDSLKKRVFKQKEEVFDKDLIDTIGKVFSILIFTVSGLIILDIMDIQLTALLAFGGVGGLAVGFAAKDIVANFFGGLMIHINRPFSIGELIVSSNKNFQGYVEDIGWYMTKIRSHSRTPVFIPNALFIDAMIENMGRMYNRRIKHVVGVRYQDIKKIQPIVNEIRGMIEQNSEVDQELPIFVNFSSFSPYSLDIEVICYTKTKERKRWAEIQQDVFLKIADIISKNQAEIAFPTNTVHLEQG